MRLFKRGKYWWIYFRHKGKTYRISLKTTKKPLAEKAKADIELKLFKGEFFGILPVEPTFKEFVENTYDAYMRTHKSPSTMETDLYRLKHLKPYFGKYKLSEIKPLLVENYITKRLKKVTPSTVNREVTLLKSILNHAVKEGILKENPLKNLKKMKEPPGRVRYLSQEEIQALIEASPPHLKPIIITALNTGLRKSDILNLKWKDVDFKNEVIKVHVKKTNEIRFVPMNTAVKNTLKTLFEERKGEYVFTYHGKPIKDIKRAFQTACRKAGIEDFRFHDLRHTFASYLAMQSVNLRTLAELMGHKTLRMVQRYSHLSPEYLKGAVEKLNISGTEGTSNADYKKHGGVYGSENMS